MGDPKKHRKKYDTPHHPWEKSRIDEEKILIEEYSLKNKQELWKMEAKLKHYTNLAKQLVSGTSDDKVTILLQSIRKYGLIGEEAHLDDVLDLKLRSIMERRLQTLVFRKGLAKSIKQARQFITHQHIAIKDKLITAPSYIVKAAEENDIQFTSLSAMSSQDHPERIQNEAK